MVGIAAVMTASASAPVCQWKHRIGAPYSRLLVAMIPRIIMVWWALLCCLRHSLLPDEVCACDGEESPEERLSRGAQRRAEELQGGGVRGGDVRGGEVCRKIKAGQW